VRLPFQGVRRFGARGSNVPSALKGGKGWGGKRREGPQTGGGAESRDAAARRGDPAFSLFRGADVRFSAMEGGRREEAKTFQHREGWGGGWEEDVGGVISFSRVGRSSTSGLIERVGTSPLGRPGRPAFGESPDFQFFEA